MLVHVVVAMLQATPPVPPPRPAAAPAVASALQGDSSTSGRRRRPKRDPRRIPLTPEHVATAFKDSAARALLYLARDSRMRQDSALQGYDAVTYQRISAGLGFARFGRDRLAFRSEQSTRVR